MAQATITSLFTISAAPAVGLSPTISIWCVDPPLQVITNAPMTAVGGGFYRYIFLDTDGYSETLNFDVLADGGVGMPAGERYNSGKIGPEVHELTVNTTASIVATTASEVWNENLASHTMVGSTGAQLISAADLLATILKYHTCRTKIDVDAKTLTIYDNNQTTPIKVFSLHDETGIASVAAVYERIPL